MIRKLALILIIGSSIFYGCSYSSKRFDELEQFHVKYNRIGASRFGLQDCLGESKRDDGTRTYRFSYYKCLSIAEEMKKSLDIGRKIERNNKNIEFARAFTGLVCNNFLREMEPWSSSKDADICGLASDFYGNYEPKNESLALKYKNLLMEARNIEDNYEENRRNREGEEFIAKLREEEEQKRLQKQAEEERKKTSSQNSKGNGCVPVDGLPCWDLSPDSDSGNSSGNSGQSGTSNQATTITCEDGTVIRVEPTVPCAPDNKSCAMSAKGDVCSGHHK